MKKQFSPIASAILVVLVLAIIGLVFWTQTRMDSGQAPPPRTSVRKAKH